jgi:hypothetical protein
LEGWAGMSVSVTEWVESDVGHWLSNLGSSSTHKPFARYVRAFELGAVDGPTLLDLTDSVLAEKPLSVMGSHRVRLLKEIAKLRPPPPAPLPPQVTPAAAASK